MSGDEHAGPPILLPLMKSKLHRWTGISAETLLVILTVLLLLTLVARGDGSHTFPTPDLAGHP